MNIELSFELLFNTHYIITSKYIDGHIRCWKISEHNVDFQIFNNVEDAVNFIVTPFPSIQWNIIL